MQVLIDDSRYKKAKKLLAHGYPIKYVARELHVHRNTILHWARSWGYSITCSDRASSQRVNSLFRAFLRLPKKYRARLLTMIRQQGRSNEAAAEAHDG